MPGPDVTGTELLVPDPPWRPRGERGGNFLRRLSGQTPLRTKLITALVALVIMALAVISVVSVVIVRQDLYGQRDQNLEHLFGGVLSQYDSGSQIPLDVPYSYGAGFLIGLQQIGSQLSASTGSNPPGFGKSPAAMSVPELPAGQWAGSKNPELIIAPAQSGGDTWRVIGQTVAGLNSATGKQQTAILLTAVDLGPVNSELQRLILIELIVGTSIVVVLAIVGVAVVRANLRPLDDIEMTAGEIAAGHLDHRVPEGDPRTEIGSLGRSLNAMLSQIERAFRAQEESERAAHQSEERMRRFIADASHELRTPLTTIRGFAAHYRMRGGSGNSRVGVGSGVGAASLGAGGDEQIHSSRTDALVPALLRDDSPGAAGGNGMPPDELDHLMGRVEAEATRMGVLVEDLLTLARLDQQRPLNIAPVDLLTVAADAVQDARIVSPGRPIDLIVAPGTAFLVDGDEPRLRQVLSNLVNNALTHTPAGTPVRVRIGSGEIPPRGDGAGAGHGEPPVPAVVLDVEDDGPGMPPDQAQRVFERFYRADAARNRASGGTGLGLAIVAGLVSAHGGTVTVRTAPGQGADFEVRLPLSPDAVTGDDPDAELA
jgi:two-component system OmpR family sensor kinase